MCNFNNLTRRIQFAITSPGLGDDLAEVEHNLGITQTVVINGVNCEIDRRFVPIIVGLNNKGYQTSFCCSGHTYQELKAKADALGLPEYTCECSPYIAFSGIIDFPILPEHSLCRKMYYDNKNCTIINPCEKQRQPKIIECYVDKLGRPIGNKPPRIFKGGMTEEELQESVSRIQNWVTMLPIRN